jgi:hypothetical protein
LANQSDEKENPGAREVRKNRMNSRVAPLHWMGFPGNGFFLVVLRKDLYNQP